MSARWWLSRRPPRPPIPRRKCALVLMSLLACHATSPHTNAIEEPTNLRFDIKHGNTTTRLTRLASSDQINPTLTQYPQRYDLRNTLNSARDGKRCSGRKQHSPDSRASLPAPGPLTDAAAIRGLHPRADQPPIGGRQAGVRFAGLHDLPM